MTDIHIDRSLWTVEVHKSDGWIERTLINAATEDEARAKFEANSTEFIVSIRMDCAGIKATQAE
jgi:hypothetical protein